MTLSFLGGSAGSESNKAWSMNDASIRAIDRKKTLDPENGLHSHESGVLGNDRYRDPQTDQDEVL